ncbi:hypothetical protein [Streptomyces apocyni]|uniref:hypothetical protein n=1 Tax=Streptomyces apocyni TaxID=2654677 RepID=UPI003899DF2F
MRLTALGEAPHAFTSRRADWRSGEEERWRAGLGDEGVVEVGAAFPADGEAFELMEEGEVWSTT